MKSKPVTITAAWLLSMGLLAGCIAPTPAAPSAGTPSATTPAAPTTAPEATEPATSEPATTEPATTAPATAVPDEATDGATPGTHPDTGMATVENVEVRILESFPVQVQAVVTGYLPDGCTTISAVEAVNEGSTFRIRITTERPADAMCTMAIVPFEEVAPLETADLPAGTYQVVVNDLSTSFELPAGEDVTAATAEITAEVTEEATAEATNEATE